MRGLRCFTRLICILLIHMSAARAQGRYYLKDGDRGVFHIESMSHEFPDTLAGTFLQNHESSNCVHVASYDVG